MYRNILTVIALALVCACGNEPTEGTTPNTAPEEGGGSPALGGSTGEGRDVLPDEPPPTPAVDPPPAPKPARTPDFDFTPGGPIADEDLGDYYAELSCSVDGEDVGTMTVEFWPQFAPATVRSFLRYCDEGFYDGTTFHRVLREFMIQGGDPTGTGMGDGPYGQLPAEVSPEPERAHRYGVISMAHHGEPDTASCQFFIINADSMSAWGLDGKYPSFGRLVGGVATLEAISDVPVTAPPGSREVSSPTKKVTIVSARAVKGEPERTETIERVFPEVDLGGEPARVRVQHVLISFAGTRTAATRTKDEAEALAADILARAKAGEDFEALVRAHSDDPVQEDDPTPGVYSMTNRGVRDPIGDRAKFEASQKMQEYQDEIVARQRAGELERQAASDLVMARQKELVLGLDLVLTFPREGMAPGFGDVSFGLDVGEIGIVAYDAEKSEFGWHIIKRLE